MRGFQLWVNLAAKDKMIAPRYQDIAPERIPVVTGTDGRVVRVIAGDYLAPDGGSTVGPVEGIAIDPLYLDVSLPAGAAFSHALPEGHSAFLYVFEGQAVAGDRRESLVKGDLAVLSDGPSVEVGAGEVATRFLLVAGRPLREPVVKYGPFVMNTRAQIIQAVDDFSSGRF